MSQRGELERQYTIKCRKCKQEYIDARKKPNQKWGKSENCPYECATIGPDSISLRI